MLEQSGKKTIAQTFVSGKRVFVLRARLLSSFDWGDLFSAIWVLLTSYLDYVS